MAPKVSALSQAFASGAPAPPATPPTSKKLQFDPVAFPCLAFAEEVDAGGGLTGGPESLQFDGLDLSDAAVVGSYPTNTKLNGVELVSYEYRFPTNPPEPL
jgi:hypothetical protein